MYAYVYTHIYIYICMYAWRRVWGCWSASRFWIWVGRENEGFEATNYALHVESRPKRGQTGSKQKLAVTAQMLFDAQPAVLISMARGATKVSQVFVSKRLYPCRVHEGYMAKLAPRIVAPAGWCHTELEGCRTELFRITARNMYLSVCMCTYISIDRYIYIYRYV